MKRPRLRTIFSVGCLIAVVAIWLLTELDGLWQRRWRLRICLDCGLRESTAWTEFDGEPYDQGTSFHRTPLSRLHRQLLGPCQHKWHRYSRGGRGMLMSWLGGTWVACNIRHYDYPICRLGSLEHDGLQLFPNDDLRRQAFRAMSDANKDRGAQAADALRELGLMDAGQRAAFEWDAWWSKHREAFTIKPSPAVLPAR